jgi:FlaA1/EpsC-like NDP-sugar epimerase
MFMSGQSVRTFYIPTSHQARRDLNKHLKDEQKPSIKNIIRGAHKAVKNYIEDNRESQKKLASVISHMDDEFKNMGPSMRNTWVNPDEPIKEIIKKEKKKKGKKRK